MVSKEMIFAYALENAISHSGRAQANSVLSKLFMEGLDKKDIKKVMPLIIEAIDSVNKMTEIQQEKEFSSLQQLVKKSEYKEKEGLKEMPDAVQGKVVMRFEPSPTGPLHIGHCLVLCLNHLYKKKYNGKLILRISDTNPESTDKEAYKGIQEDAEWITDKNIDEIIYQSDNMKTYYKYAERIIKMDGAYVCNCKSEHFKSYVDLGRACPCRHKSLRKNLQDWKKMFKEYKEGQAVLRIKTELRAKNPALREWPAFRISDTKHPRTGNKYRVWPLMNFAVAIDDIEEGMTHVIRGKDHIVNTERQKFIYRYLRAKPPVFIHLGKINFEGIHLSTRETAAAIKEGRYSGWDDIRLPFLKALRKRGIQPGAFLRFAENTGLSEVDKTVPYDEFMVLIYAFNRPLIESSSRYFFIADPVKIKIKNAPKLDVELHLHPQDKERGKRKFKTSEEFYISKQDYEQLKEGEVYRMMGLLNFEKKGKEFIFHSQEHDSKIDVKFLHWLPSSKNIKAKVLMLDGKYLEGLAEPDVSDLKEGTIIQFERFAFCKLIKKSKKEMEFWFTQK